MSVGPVTLRGSLAVLVFLILLGAQLMGKLCLCSPTECRFMCGRSCGGEKNCGGCCPKRTASEPQVECSY